MCVFVCVQQCAVVVAEVEGRLGFCSRDLASLSSKQHHHGPGCVCVCHIRVLLGSIVFTVPEYLHVRPLNVHVTDHTILKRSGHLLSKYE